MKAEIFFKEFLQRDTRERKIRTYKKIMAPLEGLINVGIRIENQAPLV